MNNRYTNQYDWADRGNSCNGDVCGFCCRVVVDEADDEENGNKNKNWDICWRFFLVVPSFNNNWESL